MKVLGIIAEYNPFHNGHKYQIKKAKECSGADYVIVIMSGPFVQRGEPALLSKYQRAKAALSECVDLIIELPVCYATSSANYFALGAVSLLQHLGVVTHLSFGVETHNIDLFYKLAHFLEYESDEYKQILRKKLKEGFSFPKARRNTVSILLGEEFGLLLDTPNNILALEYILALTRLQSKIIPVPIARINNGYHQKELSSTISSATAIRTAVLEHHDASLYEALPPDMKQIFHENYRKTFPVTLNDFSVFSHYRKITDSQPMSIYFDGTEELERRFQKCYSPTLSLEELIHRMKHKSYTNTRIQRFLIHFLLEITKNEMELFLKHDITYYGKILGFRTTSSSLLSKINESSKIPVFYRPVDEGKLSDLGKRMYAIDKKSQELYQLIVMQKFHTPEFSEKTIILTSETE